MSDERDPGDEDRSAVPTLTIKAAIDLMAAIRYRDVCLKALPVDPEAERLADEVMARRPKAKRRKL